MAESPLRADGAKIKAAREAKGWSQEKLAEMAGYKLSVIQKLEQGTYFSLRCIECCAEALDVLVADLLVSSEPAIAKEQAAQITPIDSGDCKSAATEDYSFTFRLYSYGRDGVQPDEYGDFSCTMSWDDLFGFLGPCLFDSGSETHIHLHFRENLASVLSDEVVRSLPNGRGQYLNVSNAVIHNCLVKFMALNWISIDGREWCLTPYGVSYLKARSIRGGKA